MKTYPIVLDDETHKKLKLKCFKEDITIKDVLDQAIEDFLEEKED